MLSAKAKEFNKIRSMAKENGRWNNISDLGRVGRSEFRQLQPPPSGSQMWPGLHKTADPFCAWMRGDWPSSYPLQDSGGSPTPQTHIFTSLFYSTSEAAPQSLRCIQSRSYGLGSTMILNYKIMKSQMPVDPGCTVVRGVTEPLLQMIQHPYRPG